MPKISKWSNIFVSPTLLPNGQPSYHTIEPPEARLQHQDQEPEKKFLLKHVFLSKCFPLMFDTMHATRRMRSSFHSPEQAIRVSTKSSFGQNLACHNKSHGSGLYLWICWTWKGGEKSKQSLTFTRAEVICSSSLLWHCSLYSSAK